MNINTQISPQATRRQYLLVQALLYFEVFNYPLTEEEIFVNSKISVGSLPQAQEDLQDAVEKGWIKEHKGYFFLFGNSEKVARRERGNALAEKSIPKAVRWSRLIGKFPFVRGVMLSGSLSKNYMTADSDIDYFVVTEPGRLWVARTMLILFKKVFLLNSHKNFCVNYFVDLDHLEIEDRNNFTATEVAYIFPTVDYELYQTFRSRNEWVEEWYPNFGLRAQGACLPPQTAWWKQMGEWIFRGKMGDRFDTWCMRMTLKQWQKKFGDFDKERFELTLRTRKYVSKHHPSHFQKKVSDRLQVLKDQFETENGVQL